MSTTGTIFGCVCGLLLASDARLWAEDGANPYQLIVDRNAFGLKPPPPPPDPAANKPAPPTPKITLTGITSIFGEASKRALFVYTDQEPGKPPAMKSPILREGEIEGPIEVLAINVAANTVRVKINGGGETNMTFEVQKSSPSPAPGGPPGGAPGAPPAVASIPPPMSIPSPLGSGTPTIISRSTDNDRSGITVMGASATPAAISSPISTGVTRFGGATATPGVFASAAGVGASDGGVSLSMPTRTLRSDTTAAAANQAAAAPALDPVSQIIQMRASEMRAKAAGIPHPPSPPIPGVD